jgi:hypothetical protein
MKLSTKMKIIQDAKNALISSLANDLMVN